VYSTLTQKVRASVIICYGSEIMNNCITATNLNVKEINFLRTRSQFPTAVNMSMLVFCVVMKC
jgi:hypothetical protein